MPLIHVSEEDSEKLISNWNRIKEYNMADSIDSKSINLDNEEISQTVNNLIDLQDKNSLGNNEYTETFIRYFLREEERISASNNNSDKENVFNLIVNTVIQECEDNILADSLNNIKNTSKISYADFIDRLLINELTINNYEELFCLTGFKAVEIPLVHDQEVRSIRYKDKEGITVAIVQINTEINKIRLQTFGSVLPKHKYTTPEEIYTKILNTQKEEKWLTEDGGINQFDGNTEIRYKDAKGHVMAAVIKKTNGIIDTIVEYEYINDKKSQMHHTSQFGQSKIIYNGEKDLTRLIIDIDTDGNVFGITSSIIC